MSNIHNNSVLQSVTSKAMKPGEAQNESNGLGNSGYFVVENYEENDQEDKYVDRSDYLMDALSGLATINSSRLFVQKNIMKKLAAQKAREAAKIA